MNWHVYLIPFGMVTLDAFPTKFLRDCMPAAFLLLAISLSTRTTAAFEAAESGISQCESGGIFVLKTLMFEAGCALLVMSFTTLPG